MGCQPSTERMPYAGDTHCHYHNEAGKKIPQKELRIAAESTSGLLSRTPEATIINSDQGEPPRPQVKPHTYKDTTIRSYTDGPGGFGTPHSVKFQRYKPVTEETHTWTKPKDTYYRVPHKPGVPRRKIQTQASDSLEKAAKVYLCPPVPIATFTGTYKTKKSPATRRRDDGFRSQSARHSRRTECNVGNESLGIPAGTSNRRASAGISPLSPTENPSISTESSSMADKNMTTSPQSINFDAIVCPVCSQGKDKCTYDGWIPYNKTSKLQATGKVYGWHLWHRPKSLLPHRSAWAEYVEMPPNGE